MRTVGENRYLKGGVVVANSSEKEKKKVVGRR